jgi:DNA-binding IclR family transcriptional regulator
MARLIDMKTSRLNRAGEPDRESDGERTGSLTKALDIVEAAMRQPQPPTTTELAVLLGLAKPTAHRLTQSLRELGFLQRDLASPRLVAGERLIALALDVLASVARQGPRHNILSALAEETGETCNLGVFAAGQVIYIDRIETKWPLGLRFAAGSHVPTHCTALGKMFLSYMSERNRRKYLTTLPLTRYTENTRTDPAVLEAELVQIRAEGVSFDDCEFMSGVVCSAVPIRGPSGNVVAGVAVSAPEARLTVQEARKYTPVLLETAAKLSQTFASDD